MSKFSGLGGRLHSGESSIDFIGKRRRWYALSGLLIIASMAALSLQGLHLGIEFKGGASYTVTKAGSSVAQADSALAAAGISSEVIIQKVGNDKVRIQTGSLTSEKSNALQDSLATTFGVTVDSIDTQIIGPSWGKEITRKALYGLIGFIIVVMLYLAMAFNLKWLLPQLLL